MASKWPIKIARLVFSGLALFFMYALSVQFNDDDALFWIAMYGAAFCSSALVAFLIPDAERVLLLISVTLFASLSWMAMLFPQMRAEQIKSSAPFFESELAREVSGLAIVSMSMLVLWLTVNTFKRNTSRRLRVPKTTAPLRIR